MKKTFSFLMALAMLLAACLPLGAQAADEYRSDLPIIEIVGQGRTLIDNNGNDYNHGDIMGNMLTQENLAAIGKTLALGLATGDWDPYCDSVMTAVEPQFKNVLLDKNGDPIGPSTVKWSYSKDKLSNAKSNYYVNQYIFYYDYRLDPLAVADEFNEYIDAVLERTGKSQAKFFVRCLGATYFLSYLHKFGNSKVASAVLYIPSCDGLDLCSDLFGGTCSLDPTALDRFVNYYLDKGTLIEDDVTGGFVGILVSLFNQMKVLGFGTDVITYVYDQVKHRLTPEVALATVGGFPSYWAMVNSEEIDDVLDGCFNTDELKQEYAGLIAKIKNYHSTVGIRSRELLADLEASGARVCVIAKYGIPMVPLADNAAVDGDGFVDISELTFGAQTGRYGLALDNDYLSRLEGTDREKYLSPDKMIDGSTAMFRDTTWYIKNNDHSNTPQRVYDLVNWIFHDESRNAFTSEEFPQYMIMDEENNTFVPFTEYDEQEQEQGWTNNFFRVIFRFFARLFDLLSQLIKNS